MASPLRSGTVWALVLLGMVVYLLGVPPMIKHGTELFQLDCLFLAESEKAVLIVDPKTGERIWIPLSQIDEMHKRPPVEGKIKGRIVMTAWIAMQKGLLVKED